QFQPYLDARDAIKSQLEDLAAFLRRYADGIDAAPQRLQDVEDRLALVERLKRKYGPTLSDALTRRDRLRAELDELERIDERAGDVERAHQAARAAFVEAAARLSSIRRRLAADFSKKLEHSLGELAMDGTRVEVRFNPEPLPETLWSASGIDAVELFVSPNVGEDL